MHHLVRSYFCVARCNIILDIYLVYDKFNLNFYDKAQKGFVNLSNKKSYMIINSDREIFENKKIIIKKINSLLNI